MTLSRSAFVRLWLFPACLVILLRFVHGTNLGYDPTIQIQAAQNLLAGHGLTIYSLQGQPDLAAPNQLEVLTYFPAGYSICTAALMALGASPVATLKVLGAIATFLGWWGWARLAYSFMRKGISRSPVWRYAAVAIAMTTPLLTTPLWTGTDIFLWGTVPWVLQMLVRAAESDAGTGGRFDFIAGVLSGFAVLLRYQSLFLAGYGGLVIACQSLTKGSSFFRRCLMFAGGVAPFLFLQFLIDHSNSSASFNAGGVTVHPDTARLSQYLWRALISISGANQSLIWWLPRPVAAFFTQTPNNAPWLVPLTYIVLILIPVAVAVRLGHRSVSAAARDVRSVSVGLLIVLPLFLWVCAFGGAVYVGVIRYYQPLIPIAVLAAYAFAATWHKDDRVVGRTGRLIAMGYLAGFVFMIIFGTALLVLPGERGNARRRQLLGTVRIGYWFSTGPKYMSSPARAYVTGLLQQHSETILVTNREHWFYADPAIDRSRIHRLEGLHAKYVTGPARILIFAADPFPSPDTALYWFRTWGSPVPATVFESLPDLHLVRRFPDEELKLLEADIPPNTRIELKNP